jgi:hypothetical protein
MSLETYWLVVPLVGIALTVPLWVWLLLAWWADRKSRTENRQRRH